MRTSALAAVGLAAVLLVPTAMAADVPLPPGLPSVTPAQVAASIVPIDVRTYPIEIEGSISELSRTSTQGGDEVITLASDILFAFDESGLSAVATARIGDLVKDVPKGAAVDIGGHTDSLGSTAYNRKLSTARAEAVAAVVADARPDLDLTVKGFGESDPIAPNTSSGNDDPEGRAKNRRVEIRYSS